MTFHQLHDAYGWAGIPPKKSYGHVISLTGHRNESGQTFPTLFRYFFPLFFDFTWPLTAAIDLLVSFTGPLEKSENVSFLFRVLQILSGICQLMKECWHQNPNVRLPALRLKKSLLKLAVQDPSLNFRLDF